MTPYQLILKYDLNEAKALLQRLATLGINDDVRIGIVNGAWYRTSDGFTWNELFQATSDFGLVQFCGGLADAKEKVARALKEGYRCIDIPHEDGFADVLTSSVVEAIKRIELAIGLVADAEFTNGVSNRFPDLKEKWENTQ